MYDIEFPGWSGLVRRTAALYDLPDPLDYMNHPWVPKRWRAHVREVVTNYRNTLLKEKAASQDSLRLLDLTNLSVSKPHPIWIHAGRPNGFALAILAMEVNLVSAEFALRESLRKETSALKNLGKVHYTLKWQFFL